jgi:branched-subunit amino acid transport protein
MNIWLLLVLCGISTYLIRLSFIAFFSGREIPTWLNSSLRFIPPAVLSVIIFQALFYPTNTLNINLTNTRMLAGVVATAIAWKTRNALLTILIGMAVLVVLNLLIPSPAI